MRAVRSVTHGAWLLGALAAVMLAAVMLAAGCNRVAATPSRVPGSVALPAGSYTSKAFKPAFSYTLPGGWTNGGDTADYFELRPAGSEVTGIYLFRGPLAASQDRTCPDVGDACVAASSAGLTSWIRSLEGLTVSAPRLAAVGGLRGTEIDVQIKDGWTFSCPFANGIPTVPLFIGADGRFRWVVAGNERLRLDLLDGPDNTTIVVDVDAFEGRLFDDLLAAASPIVRSFAFRIN